MKTVSRRSHFLFLSGLVVSAISSSLWAEPVPLKRVVELTLAHSSTAAGSAADEQRALASYREARNQYLPQLVVGSGLGASWGFPLSLEGSAPSLVNVNAQSALLNPALRDFVRAARKDWDATRFQAKNQRDQVIQDAIVSYSELVKWEEVKNHLSQDETETAKLEEAVNQRIEAGIDSKLEQTKARLATARARLRVAQAQGAIDVLRDHLAQLTGLSATSIETVPDSIPAFPEVKQSEDLSAKAVQASPSVQAADNLALAQSFRARAEHRSLLPSVDFAAQYALLSTYNNYNEFYKTFQRHNATVGVAIRFPFLSFSQKARAEGADASTIRAHKDAENVRNQVSEQTLKLQRSVEQLSAAQQVADLEYQVAQAGLETVQVRMNTTNVTIHDLEDARTQANERYSALQDANFELQRAHITLLTATGELENWLGLGK